MLGPQLPLHLLMLMVGTLFLPGTLVTFAGDWTLSLGLLPGGLYQFLLGLSESQASIFFSLVTSFPIHCYHVGLGIFDSYNNDNNNVQSM